MKRIFVSGSLAYDRIMDYHGRFAEDMNSDKMHAISVSFVVPDIKVSYGGTAGNIAYNLSLLGERPFIMASIGKDGEEYLRYLSSRKIDTSLVAKCKTRPTASAYIITDKDDNQIAGFVVGALEKKHPLPKSGHNDLAIVAAEPSENMDLAVQNYHKRSTPYIYDPGQAMTYLKRASLKKGMAGAQVIIGNDYEAAHLFKKSGYNLKANQTLIITYGGKGSLIKKGDKKFRIPAFTAKKVADPTGAGDAYRAGLIKGLALGYSYEKTGRLAALVASKAVESLGTQNHSFSWLSIRKEHKKRFGRGL